MYFEMKNKLSNEERKVIIMKIAIGADHGGYKLKEEIKRYLRELEIEYIDVGTDSEERTDYPIFASKVAKLVQAIYR